MSRLILLIRHKIIKRIIKSTTSLVSDASRRGIYLPYLRHIGSLLHKRTIIHSMGLEEDTLPNAAVEMFAGRVGGIGLGSLFLFSA